MSTTVTLRPDGVISNVDAWVPTGAGTVNAALADGVDSSYVSTPGTVTTSNFVVSLGTFVLPANAVVTQLTLFARVQVNDTNTGFSCHLNSPSGDTFNNPFTNISLSPGTAISLGGENYQKSVIPTVPVTGGVIDNFCIFFGCNVDAIASPASLNVYDVYLSVVYNQIPTVTAVTVAPTSPILITTRPTISWTISDPDGDSQQKFQVKVFSTAQYSIGGFDAETSPNSYSSGERLSLNQLFSLDASLANNATYKAYVKSSDGISGYSSWVASSSFSLAVDQPAVPTIVALADTVNSRVKLTINAFDNLLTTNQASLETDATGWAPLTNCAIAQSNTQAADGTFSLRLTSTASGAMSAQTPTGLSGVAVSPNTAYQFLANFRTAVSARSVNIGVKWYKADGTASSHPTDTGSNVTDSSANFNTQAVLAVTSPADAAFAAVVVQVLATAAGSEIHYVDKISLAPGTSTTWTRGGLGSSQRIVIQRSGDSGLTWTTLTRVNPDLPATADINGNIDLPTTTQTGVAYDYETVRGQVYSYRAYTTATDTFGATTYTLDSSVSLPTAAVISLTDQCKWNIKIPESPTLNILNANLEFQSGAPFLQRTQIEQSNFFYALGRNRPIKVTDVVFGDKFSITILCTTAAQYAAAIAAVNSQKTALIQDPTGRQWYVGFDSQRDLSDSLLPTLYYRGITVNCVEVDAP